MNSERFESKYDKKKHYILNLMEKSSIKEEVNYQANVNPKFDVLTKIAPQEILHSVYVSNYSL